MLLTLINLITEDVHIGSVYYVISGATDGSIAFWDLTESVEAFVQRVSTLQVDKFIDCQRRPRTGRGSQGGRWWRTLSRTKPKEKTGCNSNIVKSGEEGAYCDTLNHATCSVSTKSNEMGNGTVKALHNTFSEQELKLVDSASEIREIWPIHVMSNVHQSGVNCLHVSEMKNCQRNDCDFQFCVVSGGDDQAIHCLRLDLSLLSIAPDSKIIAPDVVSSVTESENVKIIYYGQKLNQNYRIRIFNHYRVPSAHGSAIKGKIPNPHKSF